MIEWITNNISALTLLATLILAIITYYYAIINRRMLEVSSRPAILIEPKEIMLSPDINCKCNIDDLNTFLKDQRFWFTINSKIVDLSNSPAQDVFFDAIVFFIKRKPLGNSWLPIDKPKHINFISSKSDSKSKNRLTIEICFDNFVVREILKDFCEGRIHLEGHPVNATKEEIKKKELWLSPRIVLKCFYKDIQSINYVSECQFFFHLWHDETDAKIKCSIEDMKDLDFLGIRKIRASKKLKYLKLARHLRYISFWGQEFSKNELVVLKRA